MAAQGTGGRIVNIGSTSGFMGRSRAVAYSAAKGGVANLTRAMAAQLAPHKIRGERDRAEQDRLAGRQGRVRSTRPVPNMAKCGQPQEAAKAVLFLVSEDHLCSSTAPICSSTAASRAMDLS